ncbi:MAG: DUF4145 domain-containing protein [Zoogloeaceae bacterium]|jgi:hypothetical protein|nr:DUF4145 domain-containing protein [Zoogloeaceae bacterium]
MTVIFHGDCPHCGKKDVQFTGIAIAPNKLKRGAFSFCNVFLVCNHCTGPVSLIVGYRDRMPWSDELLEFFSLPPLGNFGHGAHTVAMFPASLPPVAPQGTPDPIARTYIEAENNLKQGNFATCEMLCRKVLDTATKRLKPEIPGFFARIESLLSDGTITPAMAEWAHIVRQDGNEAVHSEEPATEQSARELTGFTEMFLMYAYSLPLMVASRRGLGSSPDAAPAS